jgi:Phage head-tail joining protein
MLAPEELQELRADSEAKLTETATIQRDTRIDDSSGGQSVSATTSIGPLACRIAPLLGGRAVEHALAGRYGAENLRVITLPALTDVRLTDRLVVGSSSYDVVDVAGPRSEEIVRRVVGLEQK